MSANHESTHIRKSGKYYSLLVLSLISGVLFQPAGWAQKPAPDLIVFTNGDQLTGTLERATGDSFVFKSDIVGEVTVTADKIKELRSGGKFVALKKGETITRTSKQPGPVTYADSVVSIADSSSSATPETVPTKELAYLIDGATYTKEVTSNPGVLSGWNGAISGGITLVESTQNGQTYNLAANLI